MSPIFHFSIVLKFLVSNSWIAVLIWKYLMIGFPVSPDRFFFVISCHRSIGPWIINLLC